MIDKDRIEKAVREIIEAIGEDPYREGLVETPRRVANMYGEIFSGIDEDPYEHLKIFDEPHISGGFIAVKDIPFYSMCEHHLMPFFGHASIVYVPKDDKIIGISKLSRIVQCYAKRAQIQEKLTNQIADFLFENLCVSSVAVQIEAEHLCMTMRGIKSIGSKTKTLEVRGEAREDNHKFSQLMSLL